MYENLKRAVTVRLVFRLASGFFGTSQHKNLPLAPLSNLYHEFPPFRRCTYRVFKAKVC
jgi:hypothetical protein